MPRFDDRRFHPYFEDHQAAAGRRVVTEDEADEVWFGDQRTFIRNRKRAGSYLMRGLTRGGRHITVVCLVTADGAWELYTAW